MELRERRKDHTRNRGKRKGGKTKYSKRNNKTGDNKKAELKRSKAPENDAIENKVWGLMPKKIGKELVRLISKVWKEERISEKCRRRGRTN